ncbi:LCP family protein [Protaetiibacter larvae]|uniref:LCP family protein n=1 Tax=Protaetiibacter larvae TaxID=2592654 RepID=UPI001FE7BFBE|nr:LCP family protein [Protaetiibacter larvae]
MTEPPTRRDRSREAREQPAGLARHGRLPRAAAWKTVLGLIAGALAVVLVAAVSVVGIAAYQLGRELADNSVTINPTEAPVPEIGAYEGGFNILVVGSDAYWDREGARNDVNIVVHISADHTSAVAVSIPRDLVVPFPSCTDPATGKTSSPMAGQPINSALLYGGLSCAVTVVRSVTGLEIQYAGMITFDGVAAMSDAVGGVDVCVTDRIVDKDAGLEIEAGTHTLQGRQALAFLRARKHVGDGSDLTRISSQQVFLSALLRKLKSEDTLTDVVKLIGLTKTAAANMQLSTELTQPATVVAMAKALNKIPMDRITFVQYPGSTGGSGMYAGKVQPKQQLADQLFAAIAADQPIGVEKVGDGNGSVVDPNAPVPAPSETPATPDPSTSATPEPVLPDKVVISGINGQSAADYTCTRAYHF